MELSLYTFNIMCISDNIWENLMARDIQLPSTSWISEVVFQLL